MCRAGAAGGQADSKLARELCMSDRHECRHFLVPDLDELDRIGALQRAKHAVDAVTGIAIDAAHTPLLETADEKVAHFHGGFLQGPGADAFSVRATARCNAGSPQREPAANYPVECVPPASSRSHDAILRPAAAAP